MPRCVVTGGDMIKSIIVTLVLAAAAMIAAPPAKAGVGLAVGVTSNPGDGIAIGYAYNYDDEKEAAATAIDECRNYKEAPQANRQCRLIGTLKNGCLAAAFDPKSDSSGMGWALHRDREAAESRALSDCRAAAPSSRKEFCRVDISKCDGDPPIKKR